MEAVRLSVAEARRKLQAGEPTLLVCAYPEDEKFKAVELEGAIPFSEFEKRLPSLALDHEIVFF